MSLRTVALDTPRLCGSTGTLLPIGSFVVTKSATMARRTSNRRSSALLIVHLPSVLVHDPAPLLASCSFYVDQRRRQSPSAAWHVGQRQGQAANVGLTSSHAQPK